MEYKYFEVPNTLMDIGQYQGYGLCSDNSCPCPETKIPFGQGYLYISDECVKFRQDAPSAVECELKLGQRQNMNVIQIRQPEYYTALLICEQGAKLRGLDLETASSDAKYWWKNQLAPLRATPMVSTIVSPQKSGGGCFIATEIYGSYDSSPVLVLRQYRDEKLLTSNLGSMLVNIYYSISPKIVQFIKNKQFLKKIIKSFLDRFVNNLKQ